MAAYWRTVLCSSPHFPDRAVWLKSVNRRAVVELKSIVRNGANNTQCCRFAALADDASWTTTTPIVEASGSGLDADFDNEETDGGDVEIKEQHTRPANFKDRTGALQKVPMVAPPKEHFRSAYKRASRVMPSSKHKNAAAKARNLAARKMDTLMKEVAVPLNKYIKGFPNMDQLHPFDAALLELTVSHKKYTSVLAKVNNLRKAALEVGTSYASRANKAANKKEAEQVAVEGFEIMEDVFMKGSQHIAELVEVARKLRGLPGLNPNIPTLALVGSPNVGKSSLVQAISSGKPEICNYPFTTRSIKMGHFYVDGRRHQITDTPGLLNRDDDDRNSMEKLTLATLGHLPTAVVYVMDLTEECGTSIEDQWSVRQELLDRFPNKVWFDVLSKADLLVEEFEEANGLIKDEDGDGVGLDGWGAVEVAARLPKALRVSSVTMEGLDTVKSEVINALMENEVGGWMFGNVDKEECKENE